MSFLLKLKINLCKLKVFKDVLKSFGISLVIVASSFSANAVLAASVENYHIEVLCRDCTIYNVCLCPKAVSGNLEKYCTTLSTPQNYVKLDFKRERQDAFGILVRVQNELEPTPTRYMKLIDDSIVNKHQLKLHIEKGAMLFKN